MEPASEPASFSDRPNAISGVDRVAHAHAAAGPREFLHHDAQVQDASPETAILLRDPDA
jgi:hypothetical protein